MTTPVEEKKEEPLGSPRNPMPPAIEAPKFVLRSSDGIEIPEDGVPFTFIRREGTSDEFTQTIVLHDTLVGLNMTPSDSGSGNSQAQTFASFALQMDGVETEEDIIKRWPDAGLQADGTSRAWRLIRTMRGEIDSRRQEKAANTMRDNNTRVTQGQADNAMRLMPQLLGDQPTAAGVIKGGKQWQPLVDLLARLIVEDDVDNPLGGDMSLAIAKAYKVLDIQRQRSTQIVGPKVTEEEPF